MPTLTFTNGSDNYTVSAPGDYDLDFLDGADTLIVNGGTSTWLGFVSTPSNTDTITDFTSLSGEGSDDELDLSGIDADSTTEGNQAFTFNHSGSASGTPGELWCVTTWIDDATVSWEFFGDLDGDSSADFQLLIYTFGTLFEDDIIL